MAIVVTAVTVMVVTVTVVTVRMVIVMAGRVMVARVMAVRARRGRDCLVKIHRAARAGDQLPPDQLFGNQLSGTEGGFSIW